MRRREAAAASRCGGESSRQRRRGEGEWQRIRMDGHEYFGSRREGVTAQAHSERDRGAGPLDGT